MRTCLATLKSITPYSQSRHYDVPHLNRETPKDYEARTWRNRLHINESGNVVIPPLAFKNALSDIAKFLSIQVPGRGKKTYTKSFEAGVLILDMLDLGLKAEDVPGEWLFVPSDGIRGSGKRVDKCFPLIRDWKVNASFHVLDDLITDDVFEQHLTEAGKFVGIGRFRPQKNGFYGRFEVVKTVWS